MRRFLFIPLILVLLASCEKALMPEPKSTNPRKVFLELWQVVDKGYPYFLENKIAWDTVFTMFDTLVNDSTSERRLFEVCSRMLDTLQDGNVKLYAGFDEYHYNYALNAPANFNLNLLERNYWTGHRKIGPLIYKTIDSVGYIYYGSFKETVTEEHMNAVVSKFLSDSVKGVILDIRNNTGGDPQNLINIYSRIDIPDTFLKSEALIYQTTYKTGPQHDKFSNMHDTWVKESYGEKLPGKFILLTNRKCYGMATLAASGCQAFPNGKIFGDTTGGGSGYPLGHELANGWRLMIPGSKSFTGSEISVEKGVPPDSLIYMSPADEANGHDTILDIAIQEAKKLMK